MHIISVDMDGNVLCMHRGLSVLVCPPGEIIFTEVGCWLVFRENVSCLSFTLLLVGANTQEEVSLWRCWSQQTSRHCKDSVVGSVYSLFFPLRPWSFSPVTRGGPCAGRGFRTKDSSRPPSRGGLPSSRACQLPISGIPKKKKTQQNQ